MTEQELAAIETRAEKATAEPWHWEYHPVLTARVIALAAKQVDVLLCTDDEEGTFGMVMTYLTHQE